MDVTLERADTRSSSEAPVDAPQRRMVSLEDAARVLHVRRETLKRWREEGSFTHEEFHQLAAVRGRGHAWVVDLDAAIREHERRWTPPRVRADAPMSVTLLPSLPSPAMPEDEPLPLRPSRRVVSEQEPQASPRARQRRDTKPLAPRPEFDPHAPIPQIPDGWVTVAHFWKTHGGRKNWANMWRERMHPKGILHVETGLWLQGNRTVMYLLAPQGQRDFAVAYGQKDWWIACGEPSCYACSSHNELTSS